MENIIEFKGELSEESKQFLLRRRTTIQVIVGILISLLGSACTIAVALVYDIIILIFLVCFAVIAILSCLPYKKAAYKVMPKSISIEDNALSLENDSNHNELREINNVKKIIDMGKWYYIIFYFPHKNIYFLCQKDLLTTGSLEEFEKLFEGKIVRKNKN